MSQPPFDPEQYKAREQENWNNVAAGWYASSQKQEEPSQVLSDRLVTLANIQSGQRVLDIATGSGEPAITAARRVGPAGRVVAIDQSSEMLAMARKRADILGLHSIDFCRGDAEQLDLADESFDAALCRWGLMFFPHLVVALDGIRRRLVTGGMMAAAVWSAPAKAPLVSLPISIIHQHLQIPQPAIGNPGPFRLADVPTLEQAFCEAGFTQVRSELMTILFEFASAEAYVEYRRAISAPTLTLISHFPPEQQANIWLEITEAARQYTDSDGIVRLPGEVICIVGKR